MATAEERAQFQLDNWQHALAVSKQTGVDPRIVMAQAAVESDWGTKAPGNNLFGIKGPGQQLDTTEFIDGKMVPVKASFRSYESPAHSFADYANLPIIQKVGAAGDVNAQLTALGKSGYATAPNYAATVSRTAQSLNVPPDVQPSLLPIVNTQTVNGPGAGAAGVVAATPPPVDPRTAGDADLVGYGTSPLPQTLLPNTATNARLLALASLGANQFGQGLMAAGAQQNTWTPQVPILQLHRPQPVPLPDLTTRRRGLLG